MDEGTARSIESSNSGYILVGVYCGLYDSSSAGTKGTPVTIASEANKDCQVLPSKTEDGPSIFLISC